MVAGAAGRCAIDALRQCRYCPKKIVWGVDEKGTRHPLDPVAPVYRVVRWDQESGAYIVERAGAQVGAAEFGINPVNYVSHYATCPGASQASKKNRPPAPRDPRAAAAGE